MSASVLSIQYIISVEMMVHVYVSLEWEVTPVHTVYPGEKLVLHFSF